LLARLRGGQVIITGRSANFSAAVRKLELGVLDSDAASAFLLERTQDDRDRSANDATLARDLATELGGLALAVCRAEVSGVLERGWFWPSKAHFAPYRGQKALRGALGDSSLRRFGSHQADRSPFRRG